MAGESVGRRFGNKGGAGIVLGVSVGPVNARPGDRSDPRQASILAQHLRFIAPVNPGIRPDGINTTRTDGRVGESLGVMVHVPVTIQIPGVTR